jgi:hypothetical protein
MSSRPSFNKRQKEQARKEKQRLKAERKQQRKLEKGAGQSDTTAELQASVPREGQGVVASARGRMRRRSR